MSDISLSYSLLRGYNGSNNQILYLKYVVEKNNYLLSDFDVKYILENYKYVPKVVNKVIKITKELAYQLNEKYDIGFYPEKIKISKIIGEMGNSYHCYVKYRQSVPEKLMYISKRHIFEELLVEDYKNVELDFDKIDKLTESKNRRLKQHQKEGVKFLYTNRKCIIADEMGLGKTTTTIAAALMRDYQRVLVIAPASLKTNWKKEIELFIDPNEITIINGSEWGEIKRFTIINYDILQNFYTIPEEPMFKNEEVRDINGNVVKTYRVPVLVKNKSTGQLVQKTQKSRKKEKVEEALKNSPLFLAKFDCVIIDEAQKLSNSTSIRYKTVNDFLHKSKPDSIYLSTGTPLTNRPINLYNILRLIDATVTSDYKYFVERYCGGREIRLKDGRKVMTMKGATNLEELKDKIKHVYIRRLTTDMNDMVEKNISVEYYDLTKEQTKEYNRLWKDYQEAQETEGNDNSENYRQLVEGMLVRQFLACEMVNHTIDKIDQLLEMDEKVVVITTFQEEMDKFKEHYKSKCVVYNGKMTTKAKDKAQNEFLNNPNVKIIVGNVLAMGVGLSLPNSRFIIFNSYDWVAANNIQAESRIHRLTQTRDVLCVYQLFTDSISQDMFEKVLLKEKIMKETIKSEKEK